MRKYNELPTFRQDFVTNLAAQLKIDASLTDKTPVLSLLGTRGNEPEWNDPLKSKGHLGIPLVSPEFVDTIPMVSRLFNQLGLGLDWISIPDEKLAMQTKSDVTGTFLVQDAKNDVDASAGWRKFPGHLHSKQSFDECIPKQELGNENK